MGDAGAPVAALASAVPADFEVRWQNIRIVAWLFGLLLLNSFLFSLLARYDHSPWTDVAVTSADALLILGFAYAMRADVVPLLALPRCDRRTALTLVLLAGSFIAVLSAYFKFLAHLGVPVLSSTHEYRSAGWPLYVMLLLISVMPGIFEELGFRGVIQSVLERTVDAREAWLIQAALFSVLHLSPIIFPSHFVMGLVLGFLRMRTRSLYPGMLLHAGWNALVVVSEF